MEPDSLYQQIYQYRIYFRKPIGVIEIEILVNLVGKAVSIDKYAVVLNINKKNFSAFGIRKYPLYLGLKIYNCF